jgi:hypothetical protein
MTHSIIKATFPSESRISRTLMNEGSFPRKGEFINNIALKRQNWRFYEIAEYQVAYVFSGKTE